MKVLANDGISKSGIKALEKGGFEVITTKVAQEQVANFINTNDVLPEEAEMYYMKIYK